MPRCTEAEGCAAWDTSLIGNGRCGGRCNSVESDIVCALGALWML